MTKLPSILTFLVLCKISSGQDSIRHFEFGSTIVTVNSFNIDESTADDRTSLELINGLFFRYNKKRTSVRVHASYSNYSSASTYTLDTYPMGPVGSDFSSKDFRIGIGGQFSILKQKDWFYTCLDFSYRYVTSISHTYGPLSLKQTSTSNGADCFLGVGFKIKLIKNFNLSPEVGYITSVQYFNEVTTSTIPYNSGQLYKLSNSNLYSIPVLKLHLTVKF